MSRRPYYLGAVTACCLAVVAFVVPSFAAENDAHAGAVETSVPSAETIRIQERLDKVASAIQEADKASQIATTGIDHRALKVNVYLKGDVPAAIQEAIDSADADITVEIRPAKFSVKEMSEAAKKVNVALKDDRIPAIISNNDGSGLTVRVTSDTMEMGKDHLLDVYEEAARMPVSIEIGEMVVPLPAGRAS